MARKKKTELPTVEDPFAKVNELLLGASGKFKTIVILGLNDDPYMSVMTNLGDFYAIRGVLAEAMDEMNVYKRGLVSRAIQEQETQRAA